MSTHFETKHKICRRVTFTLADIYYTLSYYEAIFNYTVKIRLPGMNNSSRDDDYPYYYMPDDLRITVVDSDYVMVVCSYASIFFSSIVLSTYLIFPPLRQKPYLLLIYFMTLSDLLTATGTAFGFTTNGSIACTYQGLVSNLFYLGYIYYCI